MAPDSKPPRRNRGRPSNASKLASASLDRPDNTQADVQEARHKKRGRPKRILDATEPATEPAPPTDDQPRRKRGRPSLTETTNEPEEPAPPKRKRGRPSLDKQGKGAGEQEQPNDEEDDARPEAQDEEQPEETRSKPKRGRKRAQLDQQQPEAAAEEEPSRKRGRRARTARGSQQGGEGEEEQQPPEEQEEEQEGDREQPRRKKSRRSLRDIPHEDAHNKGNKPGRTKKREKQPDIDATDVENRDESQPKKKRGRPSGARNSTGQAEKPAKSRPSKDTNEEQDQQDQQETTAKPKGRRRRSSQTAPPSDDDDDDDDAPPSPPKPWLHVASHTKRVRSSTIASKWTPLSGASLPTASAILALAHQPILQRTAATRQRREHAEAALHLVSRRVSRKLARGLPFPPSSAAGVRPGRPQANADSGRAAELDFESVLDGCAALERQLGPALHAVDLLRVERKKMERELERDYEELRGLEASARAQKRERKEQMKKAHVLAPTVQPAPQEIQQRSVITAAASSGNVFKEMADAELEPLGLQLAGHVDSIRGNLQQGDGIAPQLARTRAALQDVLMRYLDQNAYAQVILG
ncbi:CENP-Q, a CENPA-CAD centromere complex subunit-domain-containing protein [Dactylonectria macrodidyma]|uniref:CENP-Q, a CENPA-CAD centromere complex subunit-domain-containing protein n=1 Tax=Dactylonectria macrodidyma TaxID=307937 RepID=A0A9P9ERM0_9HYPO|nr:CENP-Q, a CENPA-CAD centromere complex subunit-domain-containing protein [Dactylonectria macrodidyma]